MKTKRLFFSLTPLALALAAPLAFAAVDTDGDGLSDTQESQIGTNPNIADSDGDTLNDGAEVQAGTDPLNVDTDGDGVNDNVEIAAGTDPLYSDITPPGFLDWNDPVLLGSYYGLATKPVTTWAAGGTNLQSGIEIKVSKGGKFSGKYLAQNSKISFRGVFDVNGYAQVEVGSPTSSGFVGYLNLRISKRDNLNPLGTSAELTGVFQGPPTTATRVLLRKARYNSQANAPQAANKNYTLAVAKPAELATQPLGYTVATAIVSPVGKMNFSGYLADGSKWTWSWPITESPLPQAGKIAISKTLNISGGKSIFLADFSFAEVSEPTFTGYTFGGPTRFVKGAGSSGFYPGGFDLKALQGNGARYLNYGVENKFDPEFQPNTAGNIISSFDSASNFTNAGTRGDLNATLEQNGKISYTTDPVDKLNGKFNSSKGSFNGTRSFTFIADEGGFNTQYKDTVKFNGVMLQAIDGTATLVGNTKGKYDSGSVDLLANPTPTTPEPTIVKVSGNNVGGNGGIVTIQVIAPIGKVWSADYVASDFGTTAAWISSLNDAILADGDGFFTDGDGDGIVDGLFERNFVIDAYPDGAGDPINPGVAVAFDKNIDSINDALGIWVPGIKDASGVVSFTGTGAVQTIRAYVQPITSGFARREYKLNVAGKNITINQSSAIYP